MPIFLHAESSLALNKTLDLDEVLDHVLIQARRMVPCRTLSISLRDGDRIWWRVVWVIVMSIAQT